jgi:hypothetical protein
MRYSQCAELFQASGAGASEVDGLIRRDGSRDPAKVRLLAYDEDDVRATLAVRNWPAAERRA